MPVASWYINLAKDKNLGPYSLEQLVPNGLTTDTYVWRAGMADWQAANYRGGIAKSLFLTSCPTAAATADVLGEAQGPWHPSLPRLRQYPCPRLRGQI